MCQPHIFFENIIYIQYIHIPTKKCNYDKITIFIYIYIIYIYNKYIFFAYNTRLQFLYIYNIYI